MNSDPTGNKTLKEMVGAIAANSIIQRIATSSMVGGLMSMLDTLLGADEVDPLELIESYRNGAVSGIVSGLFTMGITSFGNINCITSIISKLTMGGISAYFSAEGFKGAIESFGEGKYIQGIFRLIGAGMSARSAANEFGGAMKGANAVANGAKCFVAGTLVLTEDGEKPIEDIEVGDYVYASDPETGESDYKEVLQTFINETSELVHIHVNGDEIVSTPTHPFYSPVRGWTSAVDLKAGDILVLSNGEYVVVEQVQHEILEAPVKVYNFEVQDFHTYHVGKNSVLVHNMCKINGEIPTEPNKPESQHGNSRNSTKPQHGYEIYNTKTGDVVKTGISGQPLNKNGTSPRANTQVNKFNLEAGENIYDARIVIKDMPNRSAALEWEANNSQSLWENGNSMFKHQRPAPWRKTK